MTTLGWVLGTVAALVFTWIGLPLLAYLVAKMVTLGQLKAKQYFEREHTNGPT